MAIRADDVDLDRDRALVVRFQRGDTLAFDDLYRRYFDRLVRFCARRVEDQHEAEEIAQEAFAKAWRALPRLTGEQRFYPWLTVIASRLCVDSHRRRGRARLQAVPDDGSVEGGQERIIDLVDHQHVREALTRITPRHREVLDLREEQGWSYRQIAEHYDVSLGTVELLIFRARKALRREFDAVAGDGRWAGGLGLVAWLRGRIPGLRHKVEALAPTLSPVGANLAGLVLVVGSITGMATGSMHAAPDVSNHAVAFHRGHDIAAQMGASFADTMSDTIASPDAAGGAVPDEVRGLQIDSADAGREHAEDAPVSEELGPVILGLDPYQAAADMQAGIERYASQITENQP